MRTVLLGFVYTPLFRVDPGHVVAAVAWIMLTVLAGYLYRTPNTSNTWATVVAAFAAAFSYGVVDLWQQWEGKEGVAFVLAVCITLVIVAILGNLPAKKPSAT